MIRRHLATVVCAGGYLLAVAAAIGILVWSEIQHGDAPDANLGGIWLVLVGLPWSILGVALPEPLMAVGFFAGPVINLAIVTGIGVAIDRARRPRPPTGARSSGGPPPVGGWPT